MKNDRDPAAVTISKRSPRAQTARSGFSARRSGTERGEVQRLEAADGVAPEGRAAVSPAHAGTAASRSHVVISENRRGTLREQRTKRRVVVFEGVEERVRLR